MLPPGVLELIAFLLGEGQEEAAKNLISRSEAAATKVRELARDLKSSDSAARLARETALAETGIQVDANPYFGIDDAPKLLACLAAGVAQETRPELLLALWMKEATANVFSDVVLSGVREVTNADDAKAMFIAMNFFKFLGADVFTRYKPQAGGDNILLESGAFAAEHRAILDRANADLRAAGAAKEDYVRAMREKLTVSGGTGGLPFRVQAQGLFYPAMLGLSHALFEKIRTKSDALFDEFSLTYPLSEQLAYVIYNNGRGARGLEDRGAHSLFKNSIPRAAAAGVPLEEFLLRTKAVGKPWFSSRRNAVRFSYYLKCYAPIFA